MGEENYTTVHRGEIYFADLAGNIGSEEGGIRPVVIIQNETANHFCPTIIAAPITAKIKKIDLPTHVFIGMRFGLTKESIVLLEQIRALDRIRLIRYVGRLDEEAMLRVSKAAAISIAVSTSSYTKGGLLDER